MTQLGTLAALVAVLALANPASSAAQPAAVAAVDPTPPAPRTSPLWLVLGGGPVTSRGDCRTCEQAGPYEQGGHVVIDAGYAVTSRTDVGAEVMWVPSVSDVTGDRTRTTLLLGAVQFRPWSHRGFYLKGGVGIGFVRDWVVNSDQSFTAKGLAVAYGAGWVFRPASRVALQIGAAHHAIALGDLQTSQVAVEGVMANLWSLSASIRIR